MWKLLKDIIISFIMTVSAIIPILVFVGIDNYDDLILKLRTSSYIVIIVIVCVIVFFILSLGGYFFNSHFISNKSEKLHKLFHELRNDIMYNGYCYNDIKNTTTNISEFVHTLSKHKFNVCLKTFDFPEKKTYSKYEDISELRLQTLARAGEDEVSRSNGDNQPNNHYIKDNTDFSSIIFKRDCNIFACSNLRMLLIESKILSPMDEYQNSDRNYLKKYVTTIVIPIRIIKKKFSNFSKEDKCVDYNDYLTIGFLCVDCKKPISKALKNELTGYLMAIADTLFIPLYNYLNSTTNKKNE